MDGIESRGTVRVHFGDVPVAGGTLRMPVGESFTMRPSRTNPARRTEGQVTYTYSGFEEVPRRETFASDFRASVRAAVPAARG